MRRVISVWLPRWPIDRLRQSRAGNRSCSPSGHAERRAGAPFALVAPGRHGPVLTAVNRHAEAHGLESGLRLADARALCAGLVVGEADPEQDAHGLRNLALWCHRFTPWSAVDGPDGLWLDSTGCDHLFGGEGALADEITERLAGLGCEARVGLADTAGAAWALARFGSRVPYIAAPGECPLGPLPVEALRIDSGDARRLRRLGLTTIDALTRLPRASLARRFGSRGEGRGLLLRLDQALGRREESILPVTGQPRYRKRLGFPDPLITPEALRGAIQRMTAALAALLARDRKGARCLNMRWFRVDGSVVRSGVSMAKATRRQDHWMDLLAGELGQVDPGFGIDLAILEADRVEPLEAEQRAWPGWERKPADVDALIDRLQARLGDRSVFRLAPMERFLPEQAEQAVMPGSVPGSWPRVPDRSQRPFRLFDSPQPVDAVPGEQDEPPRQFVWCRMLRRVVRWAGPERILPEWWNGPRDDLRRDYFRVEDTEGRRYWLYGTPSRRSGRTLRWYLHGLYG